MRSDSSCLRRIKPSQIGFRCRRAVPFAAHRQQGFALVLRETRGNKGFKRLAVVEYCHQFCAPAKVPKSRLILIQLQ